MGQFLTHKGYEHPIATHLTEYWTIILKNSLRACLVLFCFVRFLK